MLNMFIAYGRLAQQKLKDFCCKENGEVNIVATVVLIGIAVLLAILFRNQVSGLITNLFTTINENANNAITNTN